MQRCYIERNRREIAQGKIKLWSRKKIDASIMSIRLGQKRPETNQFDVKSINGEYKLACNLCESCHRNEVHEFDSGIEFKHCYRVFTTSMSENPPVALEADDLENLNPYRHLLIVVDKSTSFVFLRPLTVLDENNVAMELFKIFTDFGTPQRLEASDFPFYEIVCRIVSKFMPQYKIQVSKIPSRHTDWTGRVMAFLQDWMDVNESENWVVGCPSVQWNMNNTVRNNSTPFFDVFKKEPIQDLIE
ncbi:hypothetical protein ABMA28_014880 [Loxostege sticticalis]|uniref:Integrase catalytic domain-containing protein n=1 Tax=Loxostege sticticalis TaxID=481309 RepID=A0ABD0TDI8_LOXSC